MKLRGVLGLGVLALWGAGAAPAEPKPDRAMVDGIVRGCFKSIYAQLAYIFYYMARRAEDLSSESPALARFNQRVGSVSRQVCDMLNMDPTLKYEYLTCSLDLEDHAIGNGEAVFRDMDKVKSDVKGALKLLPATFRLWASKFGGRVHPNEDMEKNYNIYRLIFNDYVIIFFNIAKYITDLHEVRHSEASAEEVFSKRMYVDGLRSYQGRELYKGSLGDPAYVLLARKTNAADTDLLRRMFRDIEAHVKPCSPEIKTLIHLFREYSKTLELM